MTVEEMYGQIEADYNDAKERLCSDRLITKFSLMFLRDHSFADLKKAMEKKSYDEGFRAAHTLKGVCQNLAFTGLYKKAEELTEILRPGHEERRTRYDLDELFLGIEEEYVRIIGILEAFRSEADA